jgi:hypothetical protein
MALNEATYISDTSQLFLFLCGVERDFEITELTFVHSMHESTSDEEILKEVEKKCY